MYTTPEIVKSGRPIKGSPLFPSLMGKLQSNEVLVGVYGNVAIIIKNATFLDHAEVKYDGIPRKFYAVPADQI